MKSALANSPCSPHIYGVSAAPLTLMDGLQAFWRLGNRFSSVNQAHSLTALFTNPATANSFGAGNIDKAFYQTTGGTPNGLSVSNANMGNLDGGNLAAPWITGMTLSCWVYHTDTPPTFNARIYCGFGSRTGAGGWVFGTGVAGLGGGLFPNFRVGSSSVTVTTACSLNTWHHVLFRYDPNADVKGTIWLDGVQVGIGPQLVFGNTTNDFFIGRGSGGGTGECMQGRLEGLGIWNRPVSDDHIADLAAGWMPDAQLQDDIIANWKGEDANDSARLYHLTEVNTPTYTSGLIDNAITLDKSSAQRLTRANASAPTVSDADFTFAVAFKPASAPGAFEFQAIASTFDSGFSNGWGLLLGGAGFGGSLRLAAYTTFPFETAIDCVVDEWNYAIVRYDTTSNLMKLRLVNSNGDDAVQAIAGANTSITDLNIGDIAGTGSYPFDGQLDELVVWDKLLTDDEVTAWLTAVQAGKTAPYLA